MERSPSFLTGHGGEDPSAGASAPLGSDPYPTFPYPDSHGDRIAALPTNSAKDLVYTFSPETRPENTFQTLSEGNKNDSFDEKEHLTRSSTGYGADTSAWFTPIVHKSQEHNGTFQYPKQASTDPYKNIQLRPEYSPIQEQQTELPGEARARASSARRLNTSNPKGSTEAHVNEGTITYLPSGYNQGYHPHNQFKDPFHSVQLGLPTPSQTYRNPLQRKGLAKTFLKLLALPVLLILYTFLDEPNRSEKMYGSAISIMMFCLMSFPLFKIREVVRQKHTGDLSLLMALMGSVQSTLWFLYSLTLGNYLETLSRLVFCFMCIPQLILFCIYPMPKTTSRREKENKIE